MITAKRLAELMTPEKMMELAMYLDGLSENAGGFDRDALDSAAAVLREVAGRCPESKDCCGNCRFWKSHEVKEHPEYGYCRKRPPVVAVNEDGPGTDWPQLSADEWCGDHEEGAAVNAFAAKDAEISKLTDEVMEMTNDIGALAAFLTEELGLKPTGETVCATAIRLLRESGTVRPKAAHDVQACIDAHSDCDGGQCDKCQHFPHAGKA